MAENAPPDLTPEEFERWLTPRVALQFLEHLNFQGAVRAILFRIRNGELRSASEKTTIRRGTFEQVVRHTFLTRAMWENSSASNDWYAVWSSGDLDAKIPGPSYSAPSIFVECINVRLDPADIARMLPQPVPDLAAILAPPPSPPGYRARSRRPHAARPQKVTREELRLWFAQYAKTNQNFRAGKVQEAAEAAFKPRPVTRQPIRDTIGEFEKTQNRGKPKVSG